MWAMTTANANVQDAGTSSNTAPHHPITGELQTLHCQVRLPVTTRESGHDPWVVYHLDYAWRLLWYAPHTNPHLSPHKPLCSPSLHLWGYPRVYQHSYGKWPVCRLFSLKKRATYHGYLRLPEGVAQGKNVETTQQSSNLKWWQGHCWKPPTHENRQMVCWWIQPVPKRIIIPPPCWSLETYFKPTSRIAFKTHPVSPSHTMPDTLW